MAKRFLKTFLIVLAVLVACLAIFLGFLTLTEFKPAKEEALDITEAAMPEDAKKAKAVKTDIVPSPKDDLRIVSWNIGYGGLSENADFFMDGGESVMATDEEGVKQNMVEIVRFLKGTKADVILLQEADKDSKRSYNIDEVAYLQEQMLGYQSTYANNFKTKYVPYPWPPIGKVDSGLVTLSRLRLSEAQRISLPCPFSWPVRTVNLKRCLSVQRIPLHLPTKSISESVAKGKADAELVVINLHLEAYDDGEGKVAQTKALLEVMDSERAKGNYVIAGGDFNQTFSNVDRDLYPSNDLLWTPGTIDVKEFGSHWDLLMDPKAPTCRSLDQPLVGADKDNFQYYMIDGFIVSDNILVKKISTRDLGFKNSDHNPVVLDIELI